MNTQPYTDTTTQVRRPKTVSVPHLVFGLLFLGIAAVKFLGEATNSDLPRSAVGFPLVLIGAGTVGLIATLVNSRARARAWNQTAPVPTEVPAQAPTEAPAEAPNTDQPGASANSESAPNPSEPTIVIEEQS